MHILKIYVLGAIKIQCTMNGNCFEPRERECDILHRNTLNAMHEFLDSIFLQ